MNVGFYILCLILMLPLAGLTAFAALLESLTRFGFWTTLGAIVTPLFDPLGEGIWGALALIAGIGLVGTGFFSRTRALGFTLIAVFAVGAVAFILYVFPGERNWDVLIVLSPSVFGFALSIYCAYRTFRKGPYTPQMVQAKA